MILICLFWWLAFYDDTINTTINYNFERSEKVERERDRSSGFGENEHGGAATRASWFLYLDYRGITFSLISIPHFLPVDLYELCVCVFCSVSFMRIRVSWIE